MSRKINQAGIDLIKSSEGCILHAYDDKDPKARFIDKGVPYKGVLTIGYGRTKGIVPGMRITQAQAEKFLAEDLAPREEAVQSLVRVPLTDNQFAALVSFVYNLGATTLRRSTLLAKLNAGQYKAAADQILRFHYWDGKPSKSLLARRNRERTLFLKL